MSEPRVRFSKLRKLLLDLEFTEIIVPESHVGFRHEPSNTNIMMPIYKRNEIVAPHHLAPVRTLLDGKGLLDRDDFERMLTANGVERSA